MTWFGHFVAGAVVVCLLAAIVIIVVNLYRAVRGAIQREGDDS